MSLVGSWVVHGPRELAEAEAVIAKCLRGEGGRCVFLRSEAYTRLRLAALYGSGGPQQAEHERLRVTLLPSSDACPGRTRANPRTPGDAGGPVLSVSWADPSEPPDLRFLGPRCSLDAAGTGKRARAVDE